MLWALFSLEGRQAERHNRLFLQNGHDKICTTGKVKVPCHPHQLYRLRWQRQAHPQDHGGHGEQEGAKKISGFSSGLPDDIRRQLLDPPSERPSEEKKKYK